MVIPPDLRSCFSRLFLNLPLRLSGIGFIGITVCWRIIMLISRSMRSSSRIRSCSSRRCSSCSCAFCWFNNLFNSSSRRFSSCRTNGRNTQHSRKSTSDTATDVDIVATTVMTSSGLFYCFAAATISEVILYITKWLAEVPNLSS